MSAGSEECELFAMFSFDALAAQGRFVERMRQGGTACPEALPAFTARQCGWRSLGDDQQRETNHAFALIRRSISLIINDPTEHHDHRVR